MRQKEINKLEEVIFSEIDKKDLNEEKARALHDIYWQAVLLKAHVITDDEYFELKKEIVEKLIILGVL